MRITKLHSFRVLLATATVAACFLLPRPGSALPPEEPEALGEARSEEIAAAPAPDPVTPEPEVADWDLQTRLREVIKERKQREARQLKAGLTNTTTAERSKSSDPYALDDSEIRRERIDAHRPPEVDTGFLPASLVEQCASRWGELLAWFGLYEPARAAYARAVALAPSNASSWYELGRMHARNGDFEHAEAAFLASFDRTLLPEQQADTLRDLGENYLAMRRPYAALDALERALERSPESLRILELHARARYETAPQQEPPPPRPVVLFDDGEASRRRDGWEASLHQIHASLPGSLQQPASDLADFAARDNGRLGLLGLLGGLLFVWLAVRRLQGRGDLAVTLAYPPELAGSFSVRIATTPGKYKRQPRIAKIASAQAPTRASTKTEHFAVSRETKFRGVPTGLCYVTVEGLLHDPGSADVVTDPFDEQAVKILSKQTVHVDFEVAPREGFVEVRVLWDDRPAKDAAVAARGLPQSLRFTRDGSTRLRLCKGTHTIVVGSGDRVAECEVELDSFRAAVVEIDLGSNDNLIFKGCPPAVEPYLHGDLSASARALERDGHNDLANLLLARLHHENGRPERAADHYQRAGLWQEAAALREKLEQWEEAAALFERAEEPARAGEMLRRAGQHLRAGECFELASDFERAIECYKAAGAAGRWVDALERNGAIFAAAKLAVDHDDQTRAIRLLQQIQSDHPNHADACEMLAAAYLQEGHRDLAIQKIEERIEARAPEETPASVHSQLASLLEEEGEFEKALSILSSLRVREPTYPNIATRIEGLRKKQSNRELEETTGAGASKPTAFLSESRYEILGEIGRGGMGVVLKARDTRLERVVALKRLPDTLRDHPKAIQLFLREAQSAARLNHPNITTVHDTDQEEGNFFITMELLEGSPISKIVKKRGRISPKNAAQLGVQIAAGLAYAHNKGIVHRDIKSANLFFTVDKVVKIMDFGLAKMMEEVRRGTTVVGGTPYYMAPEQATGETVDARADIYSFGATLYEFVTGKVPFMEGDVTYQHRHSPLPDPRTKVDGLPDDLAELILEMMAKRPEDRPATAAEVGERLARMIA
jgi:tetratricopeptide (TPR) repeat protein